MIIAVIGANYGDEGKGKMVDYFTQKMQELSSNPLVVRYNGGCQAAHTVIRDGTRHVFSQYGSGSLLGACTYLDKHVLVNPAKLVIERNQLFDKCIVPDMYIHKDCRITTIYDEAMNVVREKIQGGNASCGCGIWETIYRENQRINFTIGDFAENSLEYISDILREIKKFYLKQLHSEEHISMFMNIVNRNMYAYIKHIVMFRQLLHHRYLIIDTIKELGCRNVIFEGAQGLLLSDEYGIYPYTTPSSPSMGRILNIIERSDFDYSDFEAVYCTRSYVTRHGDGPLVDQLDTTFEDSTNIPNPYQGTLRFGTLNFEIMNNLTFQDFKKLYCGDLHYKVKSKIYSIAMSHLDQLDVSEETLCNVKYTSYGPTAKDVIEK